MTEWPDADESDTSFSKTVIIYGSPDFVELGYYDFESGQWSHFGTNIFLLKCWCYLPDPKAVSAEWLTVVPKGYKKFINGATR